MYSSYNIYSFAFYPYYYEFVNQELTCKRCLKIGNEATNIVNLHTRILIVNSSKYSFSIIRYCIIMIMSHEPSFYVLLQLKINKNRLEEDGLLIGTALKGAMSHIMSSDLKEVAYFVQE